MASELDRRFEEEVRRLTGPGGPLAVVRDGHGNAIVPGLPDTVDGLLRTFCAQHPQAELVAGDERLSFAALDALSERVARALAGQHGIAKGDRVAIAMRNCPSWVVSYMAALKAGAIATLVNGWWTPDELAHGLRLTTPKLVIADAARAERVRAAGIDCRVAELDIARDAAFAMAPLLDGAAEADLPLLHPDDDATILFTSGSTGASKGAVSTHHAVTMAAYTILSFTATLLQMFYQGKRENLPGPPAILIATPLFHVTGEVPMLLTSFALGRKMVLMPRWDAGEALRLIEHEQISYFVGVPTMSLELMQHPDRDARDTHTLMDIVAGGAPRPSAHVPLLKAAFAGHPMSGYGLTETNAVGCTNYRGNYLAKPDSTGRPQTPFVQVAIFDEAGKPQPQGATGEIGIKAAANVRGYWNNPEASAGAFTASGHFLTGDLGYLDEDGYLFIVDRAKDIIIRGGENISCLEVESVLFMHPAVAEACVFGLPCERLGEVPAAAIRLNEDGAPSVDELAQFLAVRLARFKLPTRIWLHVDPLPKLGTGKVDKKALRMHYRDAAETTEAMQDLGA